MKYYYPEHLRSYEKLRAEGKSAWAEIHGAEGFDNFCSRPFLEKTLSRLHFADSTPAVLVYGCGTGPEACFLAQRGFHVTGIDLIPTAIEMAMDIARQRGLDIAYAVQDICSLPHEGPQYDLVIDSYCLQCVVFDEERRRIFSAVKARLKKGGYYIISTAILDAEHESQLHLDDVVPDVATGMNYTRYCDDGLIHLSSGLVYEPFEGPHEAFPEVRCIAGHWYLPHRRHLRPQALQAELDRAGFRIVDQDSAHRGSLVCVTDSASRANADSPKSKRR